MLKNIFKGMIIGVASIVPGISGGIMAVSMGIYDKLIYCISHFFKGLKENLLFLAPLALGMVIAVIASSFGIDYLFETFPFQTSLLFIGLMFGSLPVIYGKVKGNPVRAGYIIAALLFFSLIFGMTFLNGSAGNNRTIDITLSQIIILFLIGIIASATMVVPGVSGSVILLILGYYNTILDAIKEFIVGIIHFNMNTVIKTILVLAPFGIGIVTGAIVLARLIDMVFQRFPLYAYWSIIGLLTASPIAVLRTGNFQNITFEGAVTGIVTFILGWFISGTLGEKE